MEARIDLYPGDFALEGVQAEFSLEAIPADRSVGEAGGIWATLEHVTIGGLTLPREQVLLMIGWRALTRIESDMSERLTLDLPIAAQ
jgi:hypothetical protein